MTAPCKIIIGLEVHVQLLTETKLFCGCGTRFGAPPNTQTCPVCLGLPGALPVLNRKAFELALRTAAALDCELARFTKWDRKNYFYPDLPKGYQISQYDLPIGLGGGLTLGRAEEEADLGQAEAGRPPSPPAPLPQAREGRRRRIRILRVHLEEDAGKSMHDEGAGKEDRPHGGASVLPPAEQGRQDAHTTAADSRIDLNRAGTPLLEVVTQPDLRSPAEAKRFLTELKLLLRYLDVSDCNMQEGSLRVDANVNLHVEISAGRAATGIVELKNLNSFRAVERALDYEARRQWSEWLASDQRPRESAKSTRGWDETSQTTRLQRAKEESSDYRYFPDPDLPPVRVSSEEIERVRTALGELPAALRTRLEATYGISPYQSDVLVNQGRPLVDYFIELADACGDAQTASHWVQQDVLRWMSEQQLDIGRYPVPPAALAGLIGKVAAGAFSLSRGREVLAEMAATGKPLAEAVSAVGIEEVDDAALVDLCRALVRDNPKIAAEVRQGILKGLGALIGQAKRKNPNVDPNRVREVCRQLIDHGAG